MTPIDLSIKGAIEEFEQGAAVNPIQQAIEALENSAPNFAGKEAHTKHRNAITSLRSLQKEVEGVELPEPIGTIIGRRGFPDGTTEFWGHFAESYKGDNKVHIYTADQLRTAVAAALGRGAGQADDTKMWAVHIIGPDDVHAVPNREIADAACVALNWSFKRQKLDDMCRAEVIEWTHGYEAWAAEKDLFRLEAVPSPEATQPTHLATSDPEGHRQAIADHEAEAPSERKALRQCVEALEFAHHKSGVVQGLPGIEEAIIAGRAALATQQAEPQLPDASARETFVHAWEQQAVQGEPVACKGDPGECAFNGACMYACGGQVPLGYANQLQLDALQRNPSVMVTITKERTGFCNTPVYTATPPAPGQGERDREDAK